MIKNTEEQSVNLEESSIYFHYKDESKPVIKITKDKFYWKDEEVEDIHNVYERFNEWLSNTKTEQI